MRVRTSQINPIKMLVCLDLPDLPGPDLPVPPSPDLPVPEGPDIPENWDPWWDNEDKMGGEKWDGGV
jgi:hypothetical protein